MEVIELSLKDAKLIKPRRFKDDRGFFQQSYHFKTYAAEGIETSFIQDNWSRSSRGVLRGLHYQIQKPQAKLVSVTRGEVYDVLIDMRENSPSFGQWKGVHLSEENGHQLFVPRGFAHGFCVLSETVDFVYKCDAFYDANDEAGIRWNDQTISIQWPAEMKFLVSEKDQALPLFNDASKFT